MNATPAPDGWYYRRGSQAVGPVSSEQLRRLLALGQVQPGQAVWRQQPKRMFFLPAATAAAGTEEQPPPGVPS